MAARPFTLIAVSPTTLEAFRVRGGEPVEGSSVSRRFVGSNGDFLAQLGQEMDVGAAGDGWGGAPVALVFPSQQISLRKLEFPFRDPRKIEQALSFELENELLEDVNHFVYTYAVVPEEDEYATVLVYLVPVPYLHGLLDVLQEHQLTPIRATFSAQVLSRLHPPASPLHYQVYLGPDEAFVSCLAGGHLQGIRSFPVNLAVDTAANAENGSEGEALAPPGPEAPEALLQLIREEAEAKEGARKRKPPRLRGELEELATDIMRFIGPHSLGQSYTVSLHGLFAPLFAWDEQRSTLALLPVQDNAATFRRPAFWGIAEELAADPEVVLSQTGINFFRSTTGWLQQLKEYRRPLIVMAGLLVLILAMLGTEYGVRVATLKGERARVDKQLQALLDRSLAKKYSVVQGVRVLEERLQKLRKDSANFERFEPNQYETMGLLEDLSSLFTKFPQLTLDSLSMKGDRFSISGTTKSYNDSESFRNQLAELERFKGSEATITHQRNRSDITYRIVINRKTP